MHHAYWQSGIRYNIRLIHYGNISHTFSYKSQTVEYYVSLTVYWRYIHKVSVVNQHAFIDCKSFK